MLYVLIFILGLFLGSFSGVIIHRLHTGEKGIFWGRSKCPKCEHLLGFWDLFPLLSYLSTKGKCRYCKTSISGFYPTVELFMGSLFFLTAYLVGLTDPMQLTFYIFISFVFVLLTVYDLLYQEVPDEISLPSIAITLSFVIWSGMYPGISLLKGVLIPLIFFGALFFGSKGRWLGGGDVRIGVLMGALLAYPTILVALFLGYLSGALVSIVGMLSGKISRKSHIPFVPFLLFGTYIAMFRGDEILKWYFNFL